MSKTEVLQSAAWAIKMLTRSFLGVLWLLGPSLIVYNIGMAFMPYTGWTVEMVRMASTNAFVIWVSVQVLFILFDRYMNTKIREGIEAYHTEYIELKKRWAKITGQAGDLETIKSLREKMVR